MSEPRYHINLFWSDKDTCWIGNVPDLHPCSAHGDTPGEALTNVRDAMVGWLETAIEIGKPVPEPLYRAEPMPVPLPNLPN